MPPAASEPPAEEPLLPALDAYLDALQAGRRPDRAALLAQHPELASVLDCLDALEQLAPLPEPQNPAGAPDAVTLVQPVPSQDTPPAGPGSAFGKYTLLAEIGRGGMGVVYRAYQKDLGRPVALKMILAGAHAGAQELARFRTEAEAVARLQHPNIVQIYEVGEQDGLPFFSLEYVDGGSLDQKIDGTPWPSRPAAQLVETLARAVHHAHEHGIVHRDLKPANVLLASGGREPPEDHPHSGGSRPPLADCTPKITDFGLAKKLDQAQGQTQSGSILGTPSYMAPEQAEGKTHDIGPAADTYALGAILYELLAGRPPFKAATPLDTVLLVISAEPVSPRLLNPKVNRDLETVCLKCLEKAPGRRYESARHLADDLRRYLAGEPIRARPISRAERLWRWCRRRPGWAALIAVSVLSAVLLIGGGVWFNRRLRGELARTQQARRDLQMALTRQVAERLDRDLQRHTMLPQMMAATLAQQDQWDQTRLTAWMRKCLERDEEAYGTCVAFEPGAFHGRPHFAPYVYRPGAAIAEKLIQYRYREERWYADARRKGAALWSKPFFDRGGGNIWMVTHSVPFFRHGKVAGIVTVDLPVEHLKVLQGWLDELQLGHDSYAFVVNRRGELVYHPNPAYQGNKQVADLTHLRAEGGFALLVRRILRSREPGSAKGTDLATGKPVSFLFAPIPSAGWALVAVVPEPGSALP
jgi:hypothetical protein